jgi:hypothetical protein
LISVKTSSILHFALCIYTFSRVIRITSSRVVSPFAGFFPNDHLIFSFTSRTSRCPSCPYILPRHGGSPHRILPQSSVSCPRRVPRPGPLRAAVRAASFVCKVENTRWPVSAAWIAFSAVSRSRISPTMMMSGSRRRIVRSVLPKVGSTLNLKIKRRSDLDS